MRLAALIVAVAAITGALWVVGQDHREDCEQAGKVSCSILLWDDGECGGGPAERVLCKHDLD